ncbi:MAG: 3-methyl-2-oxobutanoate hydroxymethyltransferase [Gammaproteobacteria bacterium RIFCSPHIGHO2_12_FULL_45_12]|nr:MAG: 3-methyl-2-oxobutanoate hydroxymethyltransferase [Gammaproteobacteria bacterium RIFCSPHIGHO2_12_FULL_45_12]
MKVTDFHKMKQSGNKITMLTCYDYTSASLLADMELDCLLVGDSVAMTMHGYQDTLSATIDMMCYHTAAVRRGAGNQFIVTDLPFLSYRKSLSETMTMVQAMMQAGANAVKLEAAAGNLEMIRYLSESGVPVMGHLGLTPQFVNALGGYKVQGKTEQAAKQLAKDALALEKAGCFALVLECVPRALAKSITQTLAIPTIGIGAGPDTDGQVLVWQDLLGMNLAHQPKFVKKFMDGHGAIQRAIQHYLHEVKAGVFPDDEHCYRSECVANDPKNAVA